MPIDLFYNTGISTYVWILSKNKTTKRIGKIQLIDASAICHKLRKPLGNKKNEFSPEDRKKITELYANFTENEYSKIYDNTEFIYKEYTVMQPLQRSYSITNDSIQAMLRQGTLKNLWDEVKVSELEELGTAITGKEKKALDNFYKSKSVYDTIIDELQLSISNQKWLSPDEFMPVITKILTIYLAVHQVAETYQTSYEGNWNHHFVKHPGCRLLSDAPREEEECEYECNGSSMTGESAFPNLEDIHWMLGIIAPFVKENVTETGTYDCAYHKITEEDAEPVFGSTLMFEHLSHDRISQSEANSESESVPSHGEWSQ